MVDHEQKNYRLGRIMICMKSDLVSRSFGRVALIVCIVTTTIKQHFKPNKATICIMLNK